VDYIRGRGVLMREEPAFSFEPTARPPAARSPTQTQTPPAAAAQSPYSNPASAPALDSAHPPAATSVPVLEVETGSEHTQLRHEDNVLMRLTAQPVMSENPLDDVVAKAKSTKALDRTAGCDNLIADCEKTIRANRKEYGAPSPEPQVVRALRDPDCMVFVSTFTDCD
jgi:hypothetical protein